MNPEWREMGSAPAGGAILQIVGDPVEAAWVASPAGLFHAVEGRWSVARRGLPLAQVGAVLARRRFVLAAGLGGGAAFSLDGGASWQPSRIEQTAAPLSCVVASPNFWQDGLLLAGTQGDGMLRSTDSGRSWQLANFGLRSFDLFSLAAAPTWGRKEPVYAGTSDGIYLSPNGGRAWKPSGLSQQAVLALALSPDFDQDQTLLAGVEDGLYRSTDGGATWRPVDLGLSGAVTVNAIYFSPARQAWLGASEHGVWRSGDGGATWTALENSPASVLCLGGGAERLCAGTFDQGLYLSADGGATWQPQTGLSARRFQWLAALDEPPAAQAAAAPAFLAGGALEGLWLVTGGGRDWLPLPGWQDGGPPLCLAAGPAGLWAGGSSGVWKAARLEQPFALSLAAGDAISALACAGELVFAGGLGGRLWWTEDGGRRWQPLVFPGEGLSLLALAANPGGSAGLELLAAVRDQRRRLVQIWQAHSPTRQVHDLKWELRLSENTAWETLQLAYGGPGAGHWAAAVGAVVYRLAPQGLRRHDLPQAHAPLQALAWSPQAQRWLAAAGEGLWSSPDLSAWQSLETGLPQAEVVAFQAGASHLAALTVEGRLWQWRPS